MNYRKARGTMGWRKPMAGVQTVCYETWRKNEGLPTISQETARRYLHEIQFSYKRYGYSLKRKHPVEAFGKAAWLIGELDQLARVEQCERLFYYESGCSPNPPIQSGWSPIGQTRSVQPLSHGEHVKVLGVLRNDHKLYWRTQRRPTVHEDVINFFDELSAQEHTVPHIVVLDNASFHKWPQIEKCRRT